MVEDRRKRGPNRRLDSWKEIASYFGRDERTVKRWEKERGIPVHRLPGAHGGVYAFSDELAQWMSTRERSVSKSGQDISTDHQEAPRLALSSTTPDTTASEDAQRQPIAHEPAVNSLVSAQRGRIRRSWILASGLLLVVAAGFVTSNHKLALAALRKSNSDPSTTPARRHLPNPKAEDLYLKGRYHWNKRTSADLYKALDYFTQAIANDPDYALAYVGLSDCYNLLREFSAMPEKEAYPRAISAARKAIELDNSLADAHNSLAFGTYYWLLDAAGAEREFLEALALNPNCALAHHWYATFLVSVGRKREALQQIEMAQKLDSSSTSILADKALILYYSGRTDDAVALLRQVDETEPTFLSTHRYLAVIDLMNRDYPEYLAESRKVARLSQNDTQLTIVSAGEKAFRTGGPRAMLQSMLQGQKKFFAVGRVTAYQLAETCALLGQNKDAIAYLRLARERHESPLSGVGVDPTLATLRADPGYREILSLVGLPISTGS